MNTNDGESTVVVDHGVRRMVVAARGLLFRPDEGVLLVQREDNGIWELPGGKLAPTDAYARTALAEEYREEVRIPVIVTGVPVYVWDKPAGLPGRVKTYSPGTHYICIVYLVYDAYPDLKLSPVLDPSLHRESRWISLPEGVAELGEFIPDETRRALDRYYQDRVIGPLTIAERCDCIRVALGQLLEEYSRAEDASDKIVARIMGVIDLANEVLVHREV